MLEQIRSVVLLAAQRFRDLATSPGDRERRHRQFAIVEELFGENRPPSLLAAEFGISVRQCYRERADIYRWIGTFIRSYEPPRERRSLEHMNHLQFRIERAAARIETGDYDLAAREYKCIAAAAELPYKIEALCKLADLEIQLGKFAAADGHMRELTPLLADEASPLKAIAQMEFLQAKLAWATGDFDRAPELLSRARVSAAGLVESDDRGIKPLCAEVQIESANRAIDRGEFAAARKYLDEAGRLCESEPRLELNSVDLLLAQIDLNLTCLRPGNGVSLRQQVRLANRAQEIAAQSGSMKRILLVEALQVQLQTPPHNAAQEVERVLAIADEFPNRRLVAMISMQFADYLLQSTHWKMADQLLYDAFPKRSHDWGILMHLRGVYSLRMGDAAAAHSFERLAAGVAERARNPRLHAATLRGLATAAHLLTRSDEAAGYIAAAVLLAENYGSLSSCRKTYQSAAAITGKSKYARAAERLSLAAKA